MASRGVRYMSDDHTASETAHLCALVWHKGAIHRFGTGFLYGLPFSVVQVSFPGFAPGLRIEAVSEDCNLVPAIPASGNDNVVTIKSIRLLLEGEGISDWRSGLA